MNGKLPPDFATVVVTASIVFLGFFTMPFWYNAAFGDTSYRPSPSTEGAGTDCILPAAEMRVEHMELLDDWRDEAIREGKRARTGIERGGEHRNKSLTATCLACHTNREEFCDVCHDYAGESPYCWDCHVDSSLSKAPAANANRPSNEPANEPAKAPAPRRGGGH